MFVRLHGCLLRLVCRCLFVMGCAAGEAQAQTVDYNSLETLFGEPVTVSATGKPQKASEAPVGLEIVTADQIRRMGVTSVPEVIARLPGVTNWQANRSFDNVGLRGQNSPFNPTLLVLVNGRQVYVDTYGYTDWSLIPVELEEIRQIEVIKGPSTALYGFNAASGVINILTVNPRYDALDEAGASLGTGDYRRGYAIKTLKISDDAWLRVSAGDERYDEFALHAKTNFLTHSAPFQSGNGQKLLADGLVQLNDHTQLRLETSYAQMDGVDDFAVYSGFPNSKSFLSGKASLSSETSIGLVEMNLYDNDYNAKSLGSPNDNNTLVLQLQDLFKPSADDTVRLLSEYRQNRLQSDVLIGPEKASLSYDVVSAGGSWTHAITPDIEWTNALRLDTLMLSRRGAFPLPSFYTSNSDYDRSLLEYSYNSGIAWKATSDDTFRAATGRGIQAPSLLSFGVNLPVPGNVTYLGNPNLDATVVTNYEVGYDRNIAGIGGKFRSTLFYNRAHDLESAILPPGATAYQFRNIGESDMVGTEFALNGTFGDHWVWDGSYTYQNAVDDFISAAAGYPSPTSLHYHDTVPHHVVKTHLGYTAGAWEGDLYGEAASRFLGYSRAGPTRFGATELDGYTTLGARLAYTFDSNLVLSLMGSDLSQARVANNYGLENERQVFVSLSKKF